jgi:chitodextrinase
MKGHLVGFARLKGLRRAFAKTAVVCTAAAAFAPAALGGNAATDFRYAGTATQSKPFGTVELFISGCGPPVLRAPNPTVDPDPNTCQPDLFPGTLYLRASLSLDSTADLKAAGHFSLAFPSEIRQGGSLVFSPQLVAFDDVGKEALFDGNFNVKIDVSWDVCSDGSFPLPIPCFPVANHGFDIASYELQESVTIPVMHWELNGDIVAPYAGGTASVTQTDASDRLDIGNFIPKVPTNLVKLGLDQITSLTLTAPTGGGYRATRNLATAGGPTLASAQLAFAGPAQFSDPAALPCDAPIGRNLLYRLVDNSWTGQVTAAGETRFVIGTPVGDLSPRIGSADLLNASATLRAADYEVDLGPIEGERVPPAIASVVQAGTFEEGSPVSFTALASDNCPGSLSYEWRFSDGGVSFGKTAEHTFDDNGSYTAQLKVTDQVGNVRLHDFTVNAIHNVDPGVSQPPDATAEWGVPLQFHADAVDAGAADQSTLRFVWDFGDGTVGAGADVVHAYAMPNAYHVGLSVTDKDGGVGFAALTATIVKRGTTAVYAGPVQGLPKKYVQLSATLHDSLGQAVPGRTVTFQLGVQSISGVTNAQGLAVAWLRLNQRPGVYPLTVNFAGDSRYLAAPQASATFQIGN